MRERETERQREEESCGPRQGGERKERPPRPEAHVWTAASLTLGCPEGARALQMLQLKR